MCLADVAEELFLIVGERVCDVKTRTFRLYPKAYIVGSYLIVYQVFHRFPNLRGRDSDVGWEAREDLCG